MITDLRITNFKSLARVPAEGPFVSFGACNVLIGPNGSGKSSLLQAIDFLRAFFRSSVEVYLNEKGWDYQDLPNLRQTRKTIEWELKANLDPDETGRYGGQYHYTVTLQPRRYLGVGREKLIWSPQSASSKPVTLLHREGRKFSIQNRKKNRLEDFTIFRFPASVLSQFDPDKDEDRHSYPEALHFRKWVERFRSYLIWDPKLLRIPSRGAHREIGPSGEHLASVLGQLKDQKPPDFNRLVRRLKGLFPAITNLTVAGGGTELRTIQVHEDKAVFNSEQMSDGILRMIAITSMLYLDQNPSVITFEEPENGVHPQLIRDVVQILRELTQRKPPNKCQIFMTTHSPYVLDEFYDHPDEVYCMERRQPKSGAMISRLSDHRSLEAVRKAFEASSLGEAWYSGLIGATSGVQ